MTLMPGVRIGPYEVTGLIGAGGMGEVYRARDTTLGRDVALKVLPESFSADRERLARFEREARTLASLNHPNIAQIYRLEEAVDGGRRYTALAIELVQGEDVAHRIAEGPLPFDEALPIARQMADALEAAHEAGIVHRDLKPENVRVRTDGTVKVLDFGLAKAMDMVSSGATPASVLTSPVMTEAGLVLGTAAYMAPEQARGRAVDKRADIWAFGVICFEMLSGRRLFAGETISDTIAAVLTRDIDPSVLPPDVPADVRSLLLRCLERDPKRRLRDIGDARIALERAPVRVDVVLPSNGGAFAERGGPRSHTNALRRGHAPGMTWLAAILGVALLGALATLWQAYHQPATAPVVQFDVQPAAHSALALTSRPAVAVSADGSMLAIAASSGGVSRLYLRKRGEVELREIPQTEGASDPAFSPDGRWIAYVTPSQLFKVSLDGAARVSLAPVSDSRGLAWLDDQRIVISAAVGTGLSVIPAAGGPPRDLTTPARARGERSHRWPAVVPGGKAVLFTIGVVANPDYYDDAAVDGMWLETGERKKVLDAASFVRCTSDGRLLFLRNGVLYAVGFDVSRLEITGKPEAVLPGVEGDATTGAGHFSMSAEGTLAFVPGLGSGNNQRTLAWVDRTGKSTAIDIAPAVFNEPAVAPDGRRIAVIVGTVGRGDVWTYDLARQLFSRLTFDGRAATPYWAPDGQTIYYASVDAQAQRTAIMRKRIDGSTAASVVATLRGRGYLGYMDPHERFAIVMIVPLDQPSETNVVKLPITPAGEPEPIAATEGREYAPTVSPNGRWVAFVSTVSGQPEVYVRELDGTGQWQVSTSGGVGPQWSPDGRELFYRNDTRQMAVALETGPGFGLGASRLLFEGAYNFRTEAGMNYAVDPVSGRFLVVSPLGSSPTADRLAVRVILNWRGLPVD